MKQRSYSSVPRRDPIPAGRPWPRVAGLSWLRGLVAAALLLAAAGAEAAFTTNVVVLKPGWNAVYLETQPEPVECDLQFASLPVESVWMWNRRFSSVQFIQDPDKLVPGQSEWLTWLRAGHPAEATMNLFSLMGAQAYLIKVADNAAPVNWVFRGSVVSRDVEWVTDSYNFVGFPVAATGAPTFQAFFAASASHTNKPIYRLNPSGGWDLVSSPAATVMKAGEAFWIRCDGRSKYQGPVSVTAPLIKGFDFGKTLTEQTVRVQNNSTASRTFTLRTLVAQPPPDASYEAFAGAVPLSYFKMDLPSNQYDWLPLPAELSSPSIAPGAEWAVKIAVRRSDMIPYLAPVGPAGSAYQSLFEVVDGAGTRVLAGVSSQGLKQSQPPSGPPVQLAGVGDPPSPYAGLWVGNCIVQKVSQPSNIAQPDTPLPVANALQYRVLIHVDASGQARMLQKVLQMWKDGTYKPDPSDPTRQVVDVPGRYVLITNPALVPSFSGASLRDGEPVPRRLSTVAYVLRQPLPLSKPGDFGVNTLSGNVVLDYDDPLNPFRHKFHPDHDNLTERFDAKLPEGQESFTIQRQVSLQFTSTDPEQLPVSGWGDTQVGGLYSERITGVHKHPIYMQGTFRLSRANRTPVLNDGL